ncbi:hypothetical protein CYFUS_006688 [Cystobacter fuscus]|uniref:DUF6310 domain-containing protein n=1 Tax=Cystobacter fuscus TaxID=43 RepID=A0A250JC97_9BACT|nr:DUF6310 domain-containing protein [Cystobacter fuscus]ATB41223.1 hypothetical protein CYFUS_006688 [Cystobacter fuscus]
MRLQTWSALLLLLTACASAPAPRSVPRPYSVASTPTSGPRIQLVSAPMEPAPQGSRIGKADLDQARALLSRARKDIEPRQWEQLDRKLTAAEWAFERFSRAARTSGQAAEVVSRAEGLAQAGRASETPLALSRVGPVLVALVLLWPSSTAGPEADSRPPWVDAQREFEARLRDVSEASWQLMAELEAQPRAAKAPAREPSPQKQPASALVEEDDPRCKPIPVPHLGGNDPHNKCADRIPNNSFPGWDVLVNGKHFDALQLAVRTLWEVKTTAIETYNPYIQRMELQKQVEEGLHERALAAACGYQFVIGVRTLAHKEMLELAERRLTVVLMPWCREPHDEEHP